MKILTIRTDKPEAEIGLFEGGKKLGYDSWVAHRDLAATIHLRIKSLLEENKQQWDSLDGLVAFQGPGSFTGLRIGLSVANALAFSLQIPVVTASGDGWIEAGLARLEAGENDKIAVPAYGSDVHVTKPKK